MNSDKQYFQKYIRTGVLVFLTIVILLLINPTGSATSIQKFSIDGRTYGPSYTISITGEIQDGNSSGEVKIIIWPTGDEFTDPANLTSNKTITASSGTFSTTMNAPDDAGDYTIVAVDIETGVISPYLYMNVVGANDPQTIEVLLTEGEIISIPLSSDHVISGSLNQSKTGGNVSLGSTTYYFLVSDQNVAYIDDDPTMDLSSDGSGMSVIGNLVEGSKIKLHGATYKFININNDSMITLAKVVAPTFTGGESVNVTILALNLTGYPVEDTIILDYFKDDGTGISSTEIITNSLGLNTSQIEIEDTAGTYHLVAGDIGHISFVVNTMSMFGDMLSTENIPKHTFACGEVMVPAVYLNDLSSGAPLTDATVTATITSKNNESYLNELELEYDSSIGAYKTTYTIPADEEIDTYYVEYKAVTSSQTQKAYTSYNIKAYDIFLTAVSKNKGESDGFAPGEEGFLVIAGTDLATGEDIDFESMTGLAANNYSLTLSGSYGNMNTPILSVMNATTFYDYIGVPADIQNEMEQTMGETFAVINFIAPEQDGVYGVQARVNISGWNTARRSINVQDVFVHGEPINKMGWYSPTVAPGATARIMITAFDPRTGLEIPAESIHEAGLVEVWSDSASEVVTEYMEDPMLTTVNGQKVLKFNVTDSNLGFHYVEFWVNATVDGDATTVIGDAWFDEKLYRIKAKPAFDSNSSTYKVFESDDTIELSVHAEDISGNPVSSASIEIEGIKYGMTGETIALSAGSSMESVTTNSDGDAMISISPEDSLKSGFYYVRIKMTTQDGVVDYGNGWFEVSNFIFYPYSTSWEVGIDQPINFTLNAFDSSFDSKEVTVTLTKIIAMGDWDRMTASTMYNDTDVAIGTINGTGYYEHPGLPRGGNFEFIFEATDGNSTEVGSAWVHTTAFVPWVDSNWRNEFPTNSFLNVTVKASEDQMWGSSAHNITDVTVEKVMQEGMWMTSYKTKSQMAAITTTEAGLNANEINVSINTSGWGQGAYMMTLKVTDDEGNEVYTDFWFQLKLASVTVTNPMRISVSAAQYHTNVTSISATTDILTKQSYLASIGNVTAGKISGRIIGDDNIIPIASNYEIMGDDAWNRSLVPQYSMVVIDSVHDTVYIEFDEENDGSMGNLSNSTTTHVFNMSVGSEFTDYTGRTWAITEIRSDGTIKLEGRNTLKNGVLLNDTIMAMSKSGKFLISNFHDDDWSHIDLDGDGEYFDDNYVILMADSTEAGKYDKVLVSDSYNFSAAYIDASAGEPIQFGGDPIYLLNNKYHSSAYHLEFSTYSQGWNGMHIGTFQNGSMIKIPFLVTTPGGEPLVNKEVRLDYLMDESKTRQTLENVNATTDSSGLALIEINTSETNIPTGSWMVHYNVTIGDEYAVANEEMYWELNRFELRNFVVAGALGTPGQIDLIKLSDDNSEDGIPGNNMLLAYGDEVEFKRGVAAYTYSPEMDRYNMNWPFNEWYYNSTTGSFNYSADGGSTFETGEIGVGATINSSSANLAMNYTVIMFNNTGDTITLNEGESTSFYEGLWNFTLTNCTPGGSANISMSYVGWPWTIEGNGGNSGPEIQTFAEGDWYWMGGLDFNVSSIDFDSVELTLRYPVIAVSVEAAEPLMDSNPANGEMITYSGSATQVSFDGQDYYIFGYQDEAGTMYDLMPDYFIETMDSVLVVNARNSSDVSNYRIGENINEFGNYYAASVSSWGGRFILLNGSATQVYPLPDWISDEPIFYTGRFSDEDVGIDIATSGMMFDEDETPEGVGEITSDDRYHILLLDALSNGVNMPTEAVYDDDADLTTLRDWEKPMMLNSIYDLYTTEQGYGDSIPEYFDDTIVTVNMSEKQAQDIGTGNMDSWPVAFPTLNINEGDNTAILKTFASVSEVNVNDSITIFVTAREFDGTPIDGTAELKTLKMTFGGTFEEGPVDDLPVSWDMSSAMINTTLVNGEGALEILPEDMEGVNYDFGEFTAFVDIHKDSGGTETLKINFFRKDDFDMGDMYEGEGPMDGGDMGDEHI